MSRLPVRFYCISSKVDDVIRQVQIVCRSFFDESDDPEQYLCVLKESWYRTPAMPGDVMHVFNPFVSDKRDNPRYKQTLIVDNTNGLLILNPDILLSTTSLMGATHCMRKVWLQSIFNAYGETALALVLGTAAHELFQAGLKRRIYSLDGIKNLFLTEVLQTLAFDLYSLGMSVSDFNKEIEPYFTTISRWLVLYMRSTAPDKKKLFDVQRLHDIENEIWSTKFGVIGKMDITFEALVNEGNQKVKKLIPLELKTGKHTFSAAHMGQVILYSYIIQDKYRFEKPNDGYLVYLKDDVTTQVVKSSYGLFRDIVILRNSFQLFHHKIMDLTSTMNNIRMRIPEQTSNLRACEGCEFLTECSLMYKCFETASPTPQSHQLSEQQKTFFETAVAHLDSSDLEFFTKKITLLEIEKQYAAFRNQTQSFWNIPSEEREISRNGLCKMEIQQQSNKQITFRRTKKAKLTPILFGLHGDEVREVNYASFIGKRVMINEEILVSKANFAIFNSYCKQICCATGIIERFSKDNQIVHIKIDKDLINEFNPNGIFRLDILTTVSHRPMQTNFGNIARLMSSNDERSRELRDIIIRGKFPKMNINTSLRVSLQKVYDSPIISELNSNQKKAVVGVLRTRCSLIFGSPGSGKTQTIVALVRLLNSLGFSVLVTSFTHVAVDNILMKLIQSNEVNNENVDFLRIGAYSRVHDAVKGHSEYSRTNEWIEKGNVDSLSSFYQNIPIVACTALGVAGHVIFNKRKFDYCILDEASQVFMATCLGPLFMARNFVLVGDQKQLPPVIQNGYAKKEGLEESLFSRLLGFAETQNYGIDPDDEFGSETSSSKYELVLDDILVKKTVPRPDSVRVFPLFIQYRMNRVIMNLANQVTYGGKLTCGSKEIEFATLKTFLPKNLFEIQASHAPFLKRALSPELEDSVIFLDINNIIQAAEISSESKVSREDTENIQPSNTFSGAKKKKPVAGYVYNDYEARLIVFLVQELLLAYEKGGLTATNIGVVSPFRKQVQHIRELMGDELVHGKSLEINTVDQYQGRDKEIIIYSCVKSFVSSVSTPTTVFGEDSSQDSSQSSSCSSTLFNGIVDSELLKDERRLNVAITRAKKKLIIVGNRETLMRYEPFMKLFKVMGDSPFVSLSESMTENDLF